MFIPGLPPFPLSLALFLTVSGLFWGGIFLFSREKKIQNKMSMKARSGADLLNRDGFLLTKTSHTSAPLYSVDLADRLFSPNSTPMNLTFVTPFWVTLVTSLLKMDRVMIVSTEKRGKRERK